MITAEQYQEKIHAVIDEIKKVVIGKDNIIRQILAAILAKGHILLEDIPGVGKTTLAMAFSKVLNMECNRMQFTPDVMPADVVGFQIYDAESGEMRYRPGAILCNLFLADEINRTSSKTQSALLEVMEEGKVTVDGVTRNAPQPFTVIATQNPIGSAGTQMLPESQLDRFMIRLSMGYPDPASEVLILKGRSAVNPLDLVNCILEREEVLEMQEAVSNIYVHDAIYEYIARLAQRTRTEELSELGVSPRGTLAVTNLAKAFAFLKGRGYLIPDDVQSVFLPAVSHRLLLKPKARVNHVTVTDIIQEILQEIPAPKLVKKKTEN